METRKIALIGFVIGFGLSLLTMVLGVNVYAAVGGGLVYGFIGMIFFGIAGFVYNKIKS